jgi:hypothetical protein
VGRTLVETVICLARAGLPVEVTLIIDLHKAACHACVPELGPTLVLDTVERLWPQEAI